MSRTRKTFDVDTFRQYVNDRLSCSQESLRESRVAMAFVLEHVLMDTGNYRGFRYLETGPTTNDGLPSFGDETRREYL
jgi:hypothetical protein